MGYEGIGPSSAKMCIISGARPSYSTSSNGKAFYGWDLEFLRKTCLQAGIHPNQVRFERYQGEAPSLDHLPNLSMIIPLGGTALKDYCGKTSIDKWHLSPLDTLDRFKVRRAVPTFDVSRTNKDFSYQLYVTKAVVRAVKALSYDGPWERKAYNFLLNPKYDDTVEILNMLMTKKVLANDIETGSGVINTVGFAWSTQDAIAINTLPERLCPEKYLHLWSLIAKLLESPYIGKVYQNMIYESMYYSRYGIRVARTDWDTMWAQRWLYPEFNVGLDNVGRFYTHEPYWKDVGKVYKEEGGKRDWSNIKDWPAHYKYNCLDTTGTYEAYANQMIDMADRGMTKLFKGYQMRLVEPIQEMCMRGLPVNLETKKGLGFRLAKEITDSRSKLSEDINPGSWQQRAHLLKSKGYALPKKRVKGEWKESTDELSLKKLRLKYPNDIDIQMMLKLGKLNKALGSYVDIDLHQDNHIRFMMNGAGTETLRFSSSKDPWDKGLNAQTLPSKYKIMYDAYPDHIWLQVDLSQAESRFVAYDSCDTQLIEMLENPDKDIHSFVASNIFEKPEDEVDRKTERQLGKKSGHGANYDMGVNTFQSSCLKEMDLVLTKAEATNVLETYHGLFPGIRSWHRSIKDELYKKRKLTNPFGFTRYFYGRMDDNTFREAYAFKPQSTIPMINNHLMLHLCDLRRAGKLDFALHLQVHDSVVLMCKNDPNIYEPIAKACYDLKSWHPEIILPAGKLVIPTEVEIGPNLGKLKELHL